MTTTHDMHDAAETHTVELAIEGMTCSSCAARIEKKLNRVEGVQATVNYATEKAKVTHAAHVSTDDLLKVVADTGYKATPKPDRHAAPDPHAGHDMTGHDMGRNDMAGHDMAAAGEDHSAHGDASPEARQRLLINVALAVPVILLGMIPALQFDMWQWLSFALASPVVVWGALPFHRVAWLNAKHAAATMDTLISIGV